MCVYIYVSLYVYIHLSRGLPKAKPLAMHLQSGKVSSNGARPLAQQNYFLEHCFFFFNFVMTWFLGNSIAMFVNIKL